MTIRMNRPDDPSPHVVSNLSSRVVCFPTDQTDSELQAIEGRLRDALDRLLKRPPVAERDGQTPDC